MMETITLLITGAGVLLMLIMVLAAVLIKMSLDEKRGRGNDKLGGSGPSEEPKTSTASKHAYNKQSIFDFMEFDRIEDNMIIQKNEQRFLMVIECQGINYDLMSGVERAAVEEGFAQFLNTLRHPIQIYTQTRTINLENSLQTYKKRLDDIKIELDKKETKYKQMQNSGNYNQEELDKQNMEILKDRNLYEYGKDIIYYTEKMSLNKNVLRKQYFVVVPYYSAEAGNEMLDKEEIRNIAFSELYTKAQALSRVLAGCSIVSKVMDSYELSDLLYSAYNRDESETYGLDKAIRAGYDELYSTAPDVLDKRMEEIDKVIEKKAYALAEEMISDARLEQKKKLEKKERSIEEFINDMAMSIISENEQYIGREIASAARGNVARKSKKKAEEGTKDGEKETSTRKLTRHK